ncbi:MAG: biotin--[acetyl-CoA-carboxylase] ligase [Campylobacterales bacterium]|nr:biotin--[acetyl-CoA-carboxylase] ligase [Campylobacterales bacterium]
MEILSFDLLPSTQRYLEEKIQSGELTAPVAVITKEQSSGIGSRDNSWSGGDGNFFASIAFNVDMLPEDLALSSASIYFSFIMKKVLVESGANVWLKWPNDFYHDNNKVGGTITKKVKDHLVCGIGINLKNEQNGYKSLKTDIEPNLLLEKYIFALEKSTKWKQVFSEYEIEFERSRSFSVHIEKSKKSLKDAVLCKDGSLIMEGKRIFSLR